MATVDVLVQGYAKRTGYGWRATGASVLIRERGRLILADPGADAKALLGALAARGVRPEDIGLVFLTHHHLDHTLNARLFPKATIADGETVVNDQRIREYEGRLPGTDIRVLATPGHSEDHASLLVPTKEGVIAIAGDVFWWEDGKADRQAEDPFATDAKALAKSRKLLLSEADIVVPGHGAPFSQGRRAR